MPGLRFKVRSITNYHS